ncbi:hypothetical protein DVT68_09605 [Dyella solisilvae]|uniref:Uncharacterized protein n=1 Tax=Dyella solisilvae TaxID=1920168 RepID=A0A370K9P7_9GAMM|nr:hypothetical protein [Dyella solisilvae]RDI98760.1 hypothetical protein DVT68_09605 [Dyella solisilvae]
MPWFDLRWLTLESLKAEWARKDIRAWLFGVVTTVVVLLLSCHPEALPTALYIDSVGVEAFLALLELQLVVGLLLYREQIVMLFNAIYASDDVSGTALRKAVAIPRYSLAAIKGDFR